MTPDPIVERLRAAGCVFAEDEAALIVAAGGAPNRVEELVGRRVAGEPLEQVLGWAEFGGRRITVAPTVFVPRRRTELLVRLAAERAGAATVIVELCCGTGAVATVLAADRPAAQVHAADIDAAAVDCAIGNLHPDGRHRFVHQGDLYEPLPTGLRGRVELLIANAPYVPTAEIALMPAEARDHEARVALDGGADGLDLHRRIAAAAPEWLAPGGWLIVETSERQAARTAGFAEAAGLRAEIVRAEELGATAVAAVRPH